MNNKRIHRLCPDERMHVPIRRRKSRMRGIASPHPHHDCSGGEMQRGPERGTVQRAPIVPSRWLDGDTANACGESRGTIDMTAPRSPKTHRSSPGTRSPGSPQLRQAQLPGDDGNDGRIATKCTAPAAIQITDDGPTIPLPVGTIDAWNMHAERSQAGSWSIENSSMSNGVRVCGAFDPATESTISAP